MVPFLPRVHENQSHTVPFPPLVAPTGESTKLPVVIPLGAAMAACAQLTQVRYGEKSDGLVTCRDAEVPGSVVVRPKRKLDHACVNKFDSLGSEIIKMPKQFTYKELKSATKCFNANRIIGHGAFGTVYKGVLPENGDTVAVKRCSHSSQGKNEFLSELSIIGSLRHRNLVRLQGWCHEKGEILLVYDLMPNGSLDKALFEARTPLPWSHRRSPLSEPLASNLGVPS